MLGVVCCTQYKIAALHDGTVVISQSRYKYVDALDDMIMIDDVNRCIRWCDDDR